MALNSKTVLMIMVDALRHDYITEEDAPFLHSLAQKGAYGSLIPSFGFEPDGAYLAGLDPEECDGGAQFWRKPGDSLFRFVPFFRLLYALPIKKWRKLVRNGIRFSAQVLSSDSLTRRMASSMEIPLDMLAQFSTPMKKIACEPGFAPHPTVFDVVRANGKTTYFHGFPEFKVHTDTVCKRYLEEERGGNDFAFLFLGDLDGIGHKFGPASSERRAALKKLDNALKRIHEHAGKYYDEVDVLVFGDHGMAEVTQTVDLRDSISRAALDPEEDAYFLDSTFARFWVKDPARRSRLLQILAEQPGGHVLTESEKETYRIRYPHNYFGDVIFVVDNGMLVHPSFYSVSAEPLKGMHGYLPGCRDNESAFVLHTRQTIGLGDLGRIDMRRISPTVLDMLGLKDTAPIPHNLTSLLP